MVMLTGFLEIAREIVAENNDLTLRGQPSSYAEQDKDLPTRGCLHERIETFP